MNKMFLNSPLEIKGLSDDSSILKIAGYANYATKDRGNEVILPEAWRKGLDNFKKNPVLLLGHDMNKPIGVVTNTRVDENGLYVEASISSAAEKLYQVQTLVRDGVLRTFSVGFIARKGRKDSATNTLYITEVELLENSIVSIPMQQDSIFSVVKSLKEAGEYEKFLLENVEEYDSTQISEEQGNAILGIKEKTELLSTLVKTGIITSEENPTIVTAEPVIENTFLGKSQVHMDSKKFQVVKVEKDSSLQEITILGNPINEILNVDISTLNILNLVKVDTSDYVVLKIVDQRSDEEVTKLFAELVNADVVDLKSALLNKNLPKSAQKQLSNTIDLMEKPIKNWNPDDYIVANKNIDYILFRSQLEADDKKDLLLLHGHVEEIPEMTQLTVSSDATEEVTQVASMPEAASAAPVTTVSVAEPNVLGVVKAFDAAQNAVVKAEEIGASATELKAVTEALAKLTSEFNAQKDKFAAANNEKVAFAASQNNTSKYTQKDVALAVIMAAGKTQAPLSIETFKSTQFGRDILKTKATITSVDALITDFTSELHEQMQIELKIAKLLRSMHITAQHFKIPVADEDTNGDIAMFANGTYNVGETDSTRVPVTRQNTITAVDLTPHKFMGTTHLAKDEQEDVMIPLLGFQVNSLMRRMARTVDKSLLRGDGSLSGFTASPTNAITPGTGYQSVITGIATLAAAQAGLKVPTGGNSTKATPTSIAAARALLGRYGLDVSSNNLVYLTSIEGYNELVTTSDFRTMDKFGPNATYLTGQIGSIYGIPVVVTEFLDNVGVSGNQVGLLVYLPGFLIGERRAFEVETWYDPRRQLTAIYLSTRFDMKALTTNALAALDTTKYSMASVVTSNT